MKRTLSSMLAAVLMLSCMTAPALAEGDLGLTKDVKPATEYTAQINAAVYDELDFSDTQEAEFAQRGLIDAPENLEILDEDGQVIWSQAAYEFLHDYEKAPDSVNPSLWENTQEQPPVRPVRGM